MKLYAYALGALMVSAGCGYAQAATRAEPKTVAAVLAADDDWLAAERRGDVAALDARLADEYRDENATGLIHPKSELLSYTANRKDKATGSTAQIAAAFRAQHPFREEVVIVGDTAILSFHSIDPATQALVRSVDVFAYQHGMWRGVLSKESNVPNQADALQQNPG